VFLTDAQLVELTGLRQPAAQRRWLATQHIPCRIRADGKNVVLASDLSSQTDQPPAKARPRFDAVHPAR
jgi:hypothetical protein